jgi:hypothetical protein
MTAQAQKVAPLIVLLVFAVSHSPAEQDVHATWNAQGLLKYQNLSTNGTTNFEQNWNFAVTGSEGAPWKLSLDTTFPNPAYPIRTTEIIAYDGTNIYSVVYSSNRLDTTGGDVQVVPGNGQYPARVCSGPFPVDHSSACGVIWFAFFAGRYLNESNSRARFPDLLVTEARIDPMAWICDLEYKLTGAPPGSIISRARYFANSSYLLKDSLDYPELDEPETLVQDAVFANRVSQYAQLKSEDLVRAVYELQQSAPALGSATVPKAFICTLAAVPGRPDLLGGRFEGNVASLVESVSSNMLPELHGQVIVEDRRVRTKDVKNGKWRKDVYYQLDQTGWITDTNDTIIQSALGQRPLMKPVSLPHRASVRRKLNAGTSVTP